MAKGRRKIQSGQMRQFKLAPLDGLSEPDKEKGRQASAEGVPVLVTYLQPFCLILNSDDGWECSHEDVNAKTYDYVKLNKLTGWLDSGLERPFHLLLGFDGSLVLPALGKFSDPQEAVAHFNRLLGHLLLGGIFSEAVTGNDLQRGWLLPTGYIRLHGRSESFRVDLHTALRQRLGNPVQTITLLHPGPAPVRWTVDGLGWQDLMQGMGAQH